jgi:flavin reductase (DIM6/NTAB) family NADH-FMN oxidoreductase RutF
MKIAVNPNDVSSQDFYKILVGSVLPRPIAWVSTQSKNGVNNLAPFSFFTVASIKPPVLCFAPAIKSVDGKPAEKDTLINIRERNEFVVNIVSRALVEPMNQSSFDYLPDESEFDAVGVTPENALHVSVPRVKESLINIECRLYQLIEIGSDIQGGTLVLGEILCVHLAADVFKNGKVDIEVLDPVGRLGGLGYAGTTDRFELKRPKSA